jgi:putative selenium metabolism hydrolase
MSDALAGLAPIERDLIRFAQRVVATPSLPEREHDVSRLFADELSKLGYRDIEVDEVGNVTAWLGEGPARLMFNGHIDHVPPAGMENPYEARLMDGAGLGGRAGLAIRGRGSCDMKANVAAGAYAAAFLDPETLTRGSYLFTADVQEETDSPLGVPALLRRGLVAEYGISGESTSLDVCLGHRGKLQFDIVVEGRSSHASTPDDGVNAVYEALPFIQAVQRLAEDLPEVERFGKGSVTVTGISSQPDGDVAVVPSSCVIRIDRRYVPGETPQSAQAQMQRLVDEVVAASGASATLELVNVYPLMTIGDDHELVAAGADAVREVTGRTPELKAWRFGVNATFMSEWGVPTIGIGPGNEDFAHTANEHVPVDEVIQASRVYARLIAKLCCPDDERTT